MRFKLIQFVSKKFNLNFLSKLAEKLNRMKDKNSTEKQNRNSVQKKGILRHLMTTDTSCSV